MKGIQLIKNNILMVFLFTITTLSYAGAPVWTLSPLTATSISVPANGTEMIQVLLSRSLVELALFITVMGSDLAFCA